MSNNITLTTSKTYRSVDFNGVDAIDAAGCLVTFYNCTNIPRQITAHSLQFDSCNFRNPPETFCAAVSFDNCPDIVEINTTVHRQLRSLRINNCQRITRVRNDSASRFELRVCSCPVFEGVVGDTTLRLVVYDKINRLKYDVRADLVEMSQCRYQTQTAHIFGYSMRLNRVLCTNIIIKATADYKFEDTTVWFFGRTIVRKVEADVHNFELEHTQVKSIRLSERVKKIIIDCPKLEVFECPDTYEELTLRKSKVVFPLPAIEDAQVFVQNPHPNQKNYIADFKTADWFLIYRTKTGKSFFRSYFSARGRDRLSLQRLKITDVGRLPKHILYCGRLRRKIELFMEAPYEP